MKEEQRMMVLLSVEAGRQGSSSQTKVIMRRWLLDVSTANKGYIKLQSLPLGFGEVSIV